MDETTLKLECLKLATENAPQPDPQKAVEAAERYWSWLISAQSQSRSEGTPNKV
jgi:hypothetical protein